MCKSKGGLKNHSRIHNNEGEHPQTTEQENSKKYLKFSTEKIEELLKKTCSKIIERDLHPENILKELQSFKPRFTELIKLQKDLSTIKRTKYDLLYPEYYSHVVINSDEYFECLTESSSTLLFIKLLDIIIAESDDDKISQDVIGHNLTERDVAGMQYLGGYVCRNIYKKIKNSKNFFSNEGQHALSILDQCRSERKENFKLLCHLDRGGLWFIDESLQKIFVITEKYFNLKHSTLVSSININQMVTDLVKFPFIIETFQTIVDKAELKSSGEIKKNLLHSLIKLYLQVRSFS